MVRNIVLLMKSNIKKSMRTSFAFFLLSTITILLTHTGCQMTEGFKRLYQEKIIETNSADFAAVLPFEFCEKYQYDINEFQQEDEDISSIEISDAILLRNADIRNGDNQAINGSWTFRNADREEALSSLRIISQLNQMPENGIYVPYVCKTFFDFQLGDTLFVSSEEFKESFIIAGFTEDVLFGSRSNIAFDLPQEQFYGMAEKAGPASDAAIVSMKTTGNAGELTNRFAEFVASKANEVAFYSSSDIEYAASSRSNNINIYVIILNIASLLGVAVCFVVIGFHMRNTLDHDIKELGTLKAIGYGGEMIVMTYALQFLLLGLLGSITGVVISQFIMPALISNIATDIGFIWSNVYLGLTSAKNILIILLLIGIVTLFLSKGILCLRPVEAFQERTHISGCKKSRTTIERMPFPINLSITLKMMDHERVKSIMISVIVAVIMSVAGFAIILFARLVNDKNGLLQITGAEVYSVNIQVSQPEKIEEIAEELRKTDADNIMLAIEPGSSKLLCGEDIYASLCVYSDYELLKNPSLYEGRYPIHENEVAISGNLARALEKEIGDTIEVSQVFQENSKEEVFLIVGLTQGTYTGGMDIYLTMQGLLQIDPVAEWQSIHVYLNEGVNAENYCAEIMNTYSERLSYAGEFDNIFYSQLSPIINSVASVVFFIIIIIILLIIIMGFFVTNSILLTQKTNFGIMKALGYSTKQIISQAVMTFMLYIAGGSVLGSIFLYFCSNAVIGGLFRGMGVYKVEFSFPIVWIVLLFICIEVIGSLTAYLAAWKVRKIVPCNLIKVG